MARYEVIGNHKINGVAPGGTVDLSDAQAEQLVAGGHVKKKAAAKKPAGGAD